MITTKQKKSIVWAVIVLLLAAFGIYQVQMLKKAHSSFDNYADFRGCVKVIERQEDYGVCQTAKGETEKIVQLNNKWYLEGDLPCGFLCF
jgi:hypothetical protein